MSEPDLIERLADRVHQAWMEAKQAQGFADHPWTAGQHAMVTIERGGVRPACDKCTLPQSLHHPDMRPYADLDEPTKEYDRATARAVLGEARELFGEREKAQREAVEAALAEVRLLPDGRVDWSQTAITDATRAVDALAGAWRGLNASTMPRAMPTASRAIVWRKAATIAARIYAHGVEAYRGDEWDAFSSEELREVASLEDGGERRPARPVQPAQAGATGRVAGGRVACPTCGGTEGVVLGMPGGVSCPRCRTGIYAIPDPDPASADHRIAEAARAWVRARAAWVDHCEECSCCDEEGGAGDACLAGAEFADSWGEAVAALIQALRREGSA